MPPAIRVENLGKSYRVGRNQNLRGYRTLRESLVEGIKSPINRLRRQGRSREGRGILGPEGRRLRGPAGRGRWGHRPQRSGQEHAAEDSLAGSPSRQRAASRSHGRVGSLLEVGTGFHPELTGRENIFLNGVDPRDEADARSRDKFDEIVAFAEVEKFLDTPVKRYSSGMYVRLAFAVAAHLEPEILIVDEVLAVGDAEFQKRCLGKIKQVSSEGGRTVLFVSHNVLAVRTLCDRAVLLRDGRVELDASAEQAVSAYLATAGSAGASWRIADEVDRARPVIQVREIEVRNDKGAAASIGTGESIEFQIGVRAARDVEGAQVAIRVSNHEGVAVFTTATTDHRREPGIDRGDHLYRVRIPERFLAPGRYSLVVAAHIPQRVCFHLVSDRVAFCVEDIGPGAAYLQDGRWGIVTPVLEWHEVVA